MTYIFSVGIRQKSESRVDEDLAVVTQRERLVDFWFANRTRLLLDASVTDRETDTDAEMGREMEEGFLCDCEAGLCTPYTGCAGCWLSLIRKASPTPHELASAHVRDDRTEVS